MGSQRSRKQGYMKMKEVSIQFSFPEESADGVKKVLNAIEEESGSRINFEIYYSNSFVENGDVVEALETNQIDIAAVMTNEIPSVFPLTGNMLALPLLNYPSWEAGTQIYLSMMYNNEDMMAEFTDNGMVFWGGYMLPGYQMFSTKEINGTDPSILGGLTIMCDNAQMQSFINANKGGAISVFPTEYVSNLQNGVADALIQHLSCAFAFGAFDYVKSAVFFGEAGFYNLTVGFAISEIFWNKLPEDLQAIFAAHASEISYESHMSDAAMYENLAYPALEANADITVLTDEEIAVWQEAIKSIVDDAIEGIKADSPNAAEAYAQLTDMIANYDEATFEIGTNNFGLEAVWG